MYPFFSLLWISESRPSDACNRHIFNFLRNCQIFSQSGCTTLYSYQQCVRAPFLKKIFTWLYLHLLALGMVSLFHFLGGVYTDRHRMLSHCGFNVHFPDDAEHLLLYLLSVYLLLVKCQCKSFVHFKIGSFVLFILRVLYLFLI